MRVRVLVVLKDGWWSEDEMIVPDAHSHPIGEIIRDRILDNEFTLFEHGTYRTSEIMRVKALDKRLMYSNHENYPRYEMEDSVSELKKLAYDMFLAGLKCAPVDYVSQFARRAVLSGVDIETDEVMLAADEYGADDDLKKVLYDG